MDDFLHTARMNLGTLNLLDWTIALILVISTVTAFMRGLIRSLVSLLGVVVGIGLACLYTPQAALWLVRWIKPLSLAQIVAFIGILAAAYAVSALLGRLLRGAASAVGLGFFDRLGGAAFGFARAVLLLAALLLPLSPWLPQFAVSRNSAFLPYLLPAAHGISFVMPRDFRLRLARDGWWNHATEHTRWASPGPVRTPSNLR